MAPRGSAFSTPLAVVLVAALTAYFYGPQFQRAITVLGVFRTPANTTLGPNDLAVVQGTTHCEDLHYHDSSKLLFTACEDDPTLRHSWFPGLAHFDDPAVATAKQGSLKVISPTTLHVQTLKFENFAKPFVTHGIDVIDDPAAKAGSAVYIFAVNHLPNKEHDASANSKLPKGRSVIEVFHHAIGSPTARHIRTVWHPSIKTPNDIFGLSPTSFLVTNDHFYREGLMRTIEDVYYGAKWTNIIHVEFATEDANAASDDGSGVKASVALTGLHNNNGLGHGRLPEDILIGSASSGQLHLGKILTSGEQDAGRTTIQVLESVHVDSVVDNPSYFSDPYANKTFDASGFIACGISNGANLANTGRDPNGKEAVMVWKLSPQYNTEAERDASTPASWEKRLLFEDDGTRIRSGSSAVIVAKELPAGSRRRLGRLFVTGFLSANIIAIDINL